jgi:hypothetical protein
VSDKLRRELFSWTQWVDKILIYCHPIWGQFLDPFLSINFGVIIWSIFIVFWVIFRRLYFGQFLPTNTGRRSPGSKIDKFWSFWTPQTRFLLYSSVYNFRSERSALRPPKKWHFSTPLGAKVQAFLWGMGNLWGHL